MDEIGARIILEGDIAQRFFLDAFHPNQEEFLRRESLQNEFDSECRIIEHGAGETMFEIDDDFFDMEEIFSSKSHVATREIVSQYIVSATSTLSIHAQTAVFKNDFEPFTNNVGVMGIVGVENWKPFYSVPNQFRCA